MKLHIQKRELSDNLLPNQQLRCISMMNINPQLRFLQPFTEATFSDTLSQAVPQLNSLARNWLAYPLDLLGGLGHHLLDRLQQSLTNEYKSFLNYVTPNMTNEILFWRVFSYVSPQCGYFDYGIGLLNMMKKKVH